MEKNFQLNKSATYKYSQSNVDPVSKHLPWCLWTAILVLQYFSPPKLLKVSW